ncbi:hypothetical protein [Psychromonas sp. Urea-02u-13]|uniref:hypothetical protein n=1 Tax=Psychromonas sp. Urea-02u-13 TaxID=2058326 RepID=UPI000C32AD28|nr:hypothetical protein [Psychromonas sp. Urea-02u-13]PKG40036.1 hypothetical protein CXF74_05595 [Psychromonas sp. Urea-02u-13]
MSQHLITQFINRTYIFKPFSDSKIANQKLKKYQPSNRKNNSSPEDVAESTHNLKKIHIKEKTVHDAESQSVIDITV